MWMRTTNEFFIKRLELMRWKGTPQCPYCGSLRTCPLRNEDRHRCYACRSPFSVTVGTLFHGSRVPIGKWFKAIWLMEESTKDPSCRSLAEKVEVNRNTACYMAMRIRRARTQDSGPRCGN